ncbi:hypothetical protein BXZ70DRAFT_925515 [Cristinia sonorae]|uniref:Uncharacterized protein n=1 Tax=Cristinia sonorae TaxID=1940300 RepID=A0A8K0UUG3_9AGAR|nr:hypothetical protein BXZ70DRAFT_925515 [Cristinia sonorae]
MMSTRTIITFPPPPPTHNVLSSTERTKLLKTTAKLGSVLGSVPHVVDDAYGLSVSSTSPAPAVKKVRQRTWSFRTKKSSSANSDSESDCSSPRGSLSSNATRFASTRSNENAWRSSLPEKRPPLLRLGLSKKLMRSQRHIVTTPSLDYLSCAMEEDDPFGAYADSSYMELDPKVPIPTFTIPSDTALRREKMRRLKRKLGENIPVHLVFPPIAESDEEDVVIHSPTTPTFDSCSSNSDSSCDSSSELLTDFEREQEDAVPAMPYLPHLWRAKERSRLRHEAAQQLPRKSSFVDTAKPLPSLPLPPVPPSPASTRTVKRRSGQFIIHYQVTDDYAVDTFDGLRCTLTRSG